MNAWAGLGVFCAQSEARAGELSGARRAASVAHFRSQRFGIWQNETKQNKNIKSIAVRFKTGSLLPQK